MENQSLENIKIKVQEIIDFIAEKKIAKATDNFIQVNEMLDELIDITNDDDDLVEICRYQVLLNHLQQKIEVLKIEMN